MSEQSIINESLWFIKIRSFENQTSDSIEVILSLVKEKLLKQFNLIYDFNKSTDSNFSKLEVSAINEYKLFYLFNLGSKHKFIDDKQFFDEMYRLVNFEEKDFSIIVGILENSGAEIRNPFPG
jgi:hypothetical protein